MVNSSTPVVSICWSGQWYNRSRKAQKWNLWLIFNCICRDHQSTFTHIYDAIELAESDGSVKPQSSNQRACFYWDHGGCHPFFHLKIQFRAGLVEPSFDTKIKSTCMYIHYTYFMMTSIWHGTVSSKVSWYWKSVTLCFIMSLLMFLWCWYIPSINIAAPDTAKTISLTSMLSRNNILVFVPFLLLHKNILSTSRCSRATCQ